jgi:hypothetical protein
MVVKGMGAKMSLKGMAKGMKMGVAGSLANLLRDADRK